MGVGTRENFVANKLRGYDLTDDIAVGESNDEAVLWSIVFVLGLSDKALAGIVVGLTGPAALVLGLIAAREG